MTLVDRRAAAALAVRMGVGLVLVVGGWIGASDEVALDRQAPWIAVAVTGLLVGAGTAALWLLGSRRAVRSRVLAVVAAVDALPEGPIGDDGTHRVRRRGGRLFHRAGCPLVAGRAVDAGDGPGWLAEGLEPCEACGA